MMKETEPRIIDGKMFFSSWLKCRAVYILPVTARTARRLLATPRAARKNCGLVRCALEL